MSLLSKDLHQYIEHVGRLKRQAVREIHQAIKHLEQESGLTVDDVFVSLTDNDGNRRTAVQIRMVFPTDEGEWMEVDR